MNLGQTSELAAEILALASSGLLWYPAYRVSSNLLLAHEMTRIETGPTNELRSVAEKVRETVEIAVQKFNKTDYRCILWGFSFAVLSSVIKLGTLLRAL